VEDSRVVFDVNRSGCKYVSV